MRMIMGLILILIFASGCKEGALPAGDASSSLLVKDVPDEMPEEPEIELRPWAAEGLWVNIPIIFPNRPYDMVFSINKLLPERAAPIYGCTCEITMHGNLDAGYMESNHCRLSFEDYAGRRNCAQFETVFSFERNGASYIISSPNMPETVFIDRYTFLQQRNPYPHQSP